MPTKSDRIKYNDVIYGFDIETTTTEHITTHYLSSFISVNFNLFKNSNDEILKSMSPAEFCRTNDDVNNYLINLNKAAEKRGEYTLIYCHNLSYEFDYLIKNIDFVKSNFNNLDALFIKPRIPLFFRVGYIEFRCSYRLLNKSLKKLGDILNFKKLEIDYKKQYFSFSKLPPEEYDYNKRDVQLMLLAVLKECSRWKFIENVKNVPLTITGLTRKNNQFINSLDDRKKYAGMCAYQKRYTKDYIKFLENTFQGGYTHANAYFVNRPLHNVASFDIVSSYIDTILHRNYPHFFKKYYGQYRLQFFKHLTNLNTNDYNYVIENYRQPFKFAFMATITLKNIKPIIKKKNLILPISASKCSLLSGVTLDNGRIYKARLIKLNVTEIDFFIISQFYDFNVVDCDTVYYTSFFKPLPDFVLKSTREYLNEKSTLKSILSKIENGNKIKEKDFFNENKNDLIFSREDIQNVLNLPKNERDDVLNNDYGVAKNKLNAQYGINVQKLLTPIIRYDTEKDYFTIDSDDFVTAKVLYRDFIKGLYITAYSRLNLFCYGLYVIERTKTKLIYSDTDSWKMYGDLKKVKAVNNEYNRKIETIVNNSVDYNVGYFDFECVYADFSTLGCKKYIYSNGKQIVTTIAGVSKKNASKAYSELFKTLNYDFTMLCQVAFNPCTILSYTITDKLVTKYNTGEYNLIVTDDNGVTGEIFGFNMVELESSDYILMDYDKPSVNEYINYFSTLQERPTDVIPTYIYRENDIVKYKYITDWKAAIKVLRGDDVEFMNINI